MKKVLIIADLFYASPRIPGLCKYLIEFGWEATILTSPIGNVPRGRLVIPAKYAHIIEISYKDMIAFCKGIAGLRQNESVFAQLEQKFSSEKKSLMESILSYAFKLGGTILAYPDIMRSWRLPAIKTGRKLLEEENFDLILSSSFPVTSHCIAFALCKKKRITWLADLRDLWTQNNNYLYPGRKFLETRLEKRTLLKANAFSTVSNSLSTKLKNRYPAKDVHVITNGFDPDLINYPASSLTKEFTITYTGLTYQEKQNPGRLFKAIQELISAELIDRNKVQIRFYGVIQKWITRLAKEFNIDDIVNQYGTILRADAVKRQRESQVLLMYGWEDEGETGVLPLKMFEYFAARRPIIATGGTPKEQFRAILDTTQAGNYAIETETIKKLLLKYYLSYLKTGAVIYNGIPNEMNKYSHREMAKKFSQAFEEMILKQKQV